MVLPLDMWCVSSSCNVVAKTMILEIPDSCITSVTNLPGDLVFFSFDFPIWEITLGCLIELLLGL